MLDLSKNYQTSAGNRVTQLRHITHNGRKVTWVRPIQGLIDMGEDCQPRSQTWRENGFINFWSASVDDLVEVPEKEGEHG
jgi:hypothetical protein